MDVREKLVELLNGVQHYGTICAMSQMDDRYASITQVSNTEVAERLIAHGVTVQEWISVKERLPEDSTTVNLCTRSKIVGTGFYNKYTKSWVQYYSGGSISVDVTHWMPLPQPPKGE